MYADREEQEDELLALQSIFDSEEFVRDESKFAGEIRVSVELPASFAVALREGETLRKDEISFLPPLCLTFDLPENYPSSSPPTFTLTCSWLTDKQLAALSAQLADFYLASRGTVVLFAWVQFLKDDALSFLGIQSVLELPSEEQSIVSDISAASSGAGDPREIHPDGENPSTAVRGSKDPQEYSASSSGEVSENGLNSSLVKTNKSPDSNQTSETSESEQTIKTCEFQADSDQSPSTVSDANVQEETINEGDSSTSSPSPSTSSQSQIGKNSAYSLPPKIAAQGQYRTPCGVSLTRSQALLSELLVYDATQRVKAFASSVFDCGVCFVGLLGSDCMQIPGCGHIFCRSCLREFCKVQITEGTVHRVSCPDAGCSESPTPAQVRNLVGEELFSRYDRLLLQMSLDSMGDVIYCPRHTCASVVIAEKSSRAAMCSVCHFAFCVSCRKTYHGEQGCESEKKKIKKEEIPYDPQGTEKALPRSKEGLQALWDDYSRGSKKRKQLLESRYGRTRLTHTTEEFLSEDWMAVNSKNCPYCFRRIQKISGCNMMTCSKCTRLFCWACLTKLAETRDHFSASPECSYYTYPSQD